MISYVDLVSLLWWDTEFYIISLNFTHFYCVIYNWSSWEFSHLKARTKGHNSVKIIWLYEDDYSHVHKGSWMILWDSLKWYYQIYVDGTWSSTRNWNCKHVCYTCKSVTVLNLIVLRLIRLSVVIIVTIYFISFPHHDRAFLFYLLIGRINRLILVRIIYSDLSWSSTLNSRLIEKKLCQFVLFNFPPPHLYLLVLLSLLFLFLLLLLPFFSFLAFQFRLILFLFRTRLRDILWRKNYQ